MPLKEKALKRLAEKLNAAGVPWAITGDFLLCQKGAADEWHTFELVTPADAQAAADKVLTRLGMRHEVPDGVSHFCCEYHFDGADIRLVCGYAMSCEGQVMHHAWSELAMGETLTVLGVSVPTLRLEHVLALAMLNGQCVQAKRIAAVLKANGYDAAAFSSATAEPMPEPVFSAICKLMEDEQ